MRIAFFLAACGLANLLLAESKTQSFDADPNWEAVNNRKLPDKRPQVTQDFGYADGKIGGTITRASECAFYADKTEPKTLDYKLSASGSFALTKTTAGSGIFFGFFNANQPGTS